MKAAVLHAPRQPMTIEEVAIEKPKRREVLVRTAAAGLCHSDLHFIEGAYPTPVPVVLGHESAGIVEEVGEDVTYVQPGDHVISCLSVFCGHCEFCLSGHPSICQTPEVKTPPGVAKRLTWQGQHLNQFLNLSSFAEQMVVHAHALVKIRPDMPLDLASLIGCSVVTGYGAVVHTARIEPGSTVAVFGAGGIGLATINAAQIAGAARIIAIDKDPFKLDLAKSFGATDTVDANEGDTVKRVVALTGGGVGMAAINGAAIAGAGRIIAIDTNPAKLQLATKLGATDIVDPRNGDVVQQVRDLTGGGVQHSFEVLGRKETAEQCFAMLAPGGTATIVGMIPFGQKIELHGFDFLRERRIQGSSMGSNHFRVDMPRLIEFYMRGKLHLEDWISAKLKLSEINEGFANMKAGKTLRSVIMFDS